MRPKQEGVPRVYKNVMPHVDDIMILNGERLRVLDYENGYLYFTGAELLDKNYQPIKETFIHPSDFVWVSYFVLCYHEGGHEK